MTAASSDDAKEGAVAFQPIGRYRAEAGRKYDVPRQGYLNAGRPGVVELEAGRGFEQALRDLAGFERLWLVFHFHRNSGWRPTVSPPVPPRDGRRVGVFASRSPYRPNPIGLTCVRLLAVDGLRLTVDEADLVDGTPILDIKPYIPRADAFPEARAGWVDEQAPDLWTVVESARFHEQAARILAWQGPDLAATAALQLRENPFDGSRKRVEVAGDSGVLSIRMFRIHFAIDAVARAITLEAVASGYSPEELADLADDPYGDKSIHLRFVAEFSQTPDAPPPGDAQNSLTQ